MKEHKKYIISFLVFCALLFTAPHVYSLWDFEYLSPGDMYGLDKRDWEHQNPGETAYMSFPEWDAAQDKRIADSYAWFGDQCASSFDPWWEGTGTYDKDFGREE